jgi:hypothetical protein
MDLTDNPNPNPNPNPNFNSNSNSNSNSMFNYASKECLLSTLHGITEIDPQGNLVTFDMPPGVTMKYLSMSTPLGYCVLSPPSGAYEIPPVDRHPDESIDDVCANIADYGTENTSELFLEIGDIAKKLALVEDEREYETGIQNLAHSLKTYTDRSVTPSSKQRTGSAFEKITGATSDEMDESDMLTTAQVNFDSRQHHAHFSRAEASKLAAHLQFQRDVPEIGRIITVSQGESFPDYVYRCLASGYSQSNLENKIINMNTGEKIMVPRTSTTMKSIKLSHIIHNLKAENPDSDILLLFVSFSCEQPLNTYGATSQPDIRKAGRDYNGKKGGTRKKRKGTKKRRRTRRKITKR